MRTAFLLVTIVTYSAFLKAQTIVTGTVHVKPVPTDVSYVTVKLIINDSIIDHSRSINDPGTPFVLLSPPIDSVRVLVDYSGCGLFVTKFFRISRNQINDIGLISFNFDDRSNQCPLNPADKVIPVEYGVMTKSLRKKIDRKEVHWGSGCIIPCDKVKNYHCTVHELTY